MTLFACRMEKPPPSFRPTEGRTNNLLTASVCLEVPDNAPLRSPRASSWRPSPCCLGLGQQERGSRGGNQAAGRNTGSESQRGNNQGLSGSRQRKATVRLGGKGVGQLRAQGHSRPGRAKDATAVQMSLGKGGPAPTRGNQLRGLAGGLHSSVTRVSPQPPVHPPIHVHPSAHHPSSIHPPSHPYSAE